MEPGEAFLAALRGSVEAREELAKLAYRSLEELLDAVAARTGGEAAPDTVAASSRPEVVLAAAALRRGKGGRLRILVPRDPVPGWAPLLAVVDRLVEEGLGEAYRVPFWPGGRLRAREAARSVARVARGFSARTVDVTDASPIVVAGLYGAGVRSLTVLVDAGYAAVFQRFGYT